MKPNLVRTTSHITTLDGERVAFVVDLPAGLVDVSDRPEIKTFGRVKPTLEDPASFDGHSFEVHLSDPFLQAVGVDGWNAIVARRAPTDPPETVLVRETTADGFLQVTRTPRAEGGVDIVAMRLVVHGHVAVLCRGGHTGPTNEPAEALTDTVIASCRSFVITEVGPAGAAPSRP